MILIKYSSDENPISMDLSDLAREGDELVLIQNDVLSPLVNHQRYTRFWEEEQKSTLSKKILKQGNMEKKIRSFHSYRTMS